MCVCVCMHDSDVKLSMKKMVGSENAAKELIVKNCIRNTRWSFMLSIKAKQVTFKEDIPSRTDSREKSLA